MLMMMISMMMSMIIFREVKLKCHSIVHFNFLRQWILQFWEFGSIICPVRPYIEYDLEQ